jgi:hypothetical protein
MAKTQNDFATEVAAIRIILAHVVARLDYETRRDISEQINRDFERPLGGHPFGQSEMDAAPWAAPYRAAIDQLLAQAETLSAERK